MARQAIRATDVETEEQVKLRQQYKGRQLAAVSISKPFSELSAVEKDDLLKKLAIQAGLIDDSDDE